MPIPPDDVGYNKAAIIERAIRRMRQELSADPDLRNSTHVGALTLNLERACRAAIDLALHVVSTRHLGMPLRSAEHDWESLVDFCREMGTEIAL